MGYIFLAIALFAGVTKGYCGKKTSNLVQSFSDSLFVNIIRMFFCLLIGGLVLLFADNIVFAGSYKMVLIGALSGVTTAIFVTTWLLSIKKGAYMLVEIFLMMGVLLTVILNFFVFKENIILRQIIGIAILIIAIICMCVYQYKSIGKLNIWTWFLLALCGISNGICDFSQKLFVNISGQENIPIFQIYTYCFSLLTLFLVWGIVKKTEINHLKNSTDNTKVTIFPLNLRKAIIYIIVMAVCLYANSYFKTLSSAHLSAVILYPLNQGMSLLLSTIMSSVLFKEKPSKISIMGIIFAFVALFLLHN